MRQHTMMAALLALGLAGACAAPDPASQSGTAQPVTRARPGNAGAASDADLDLVGMLAPVPEYEGRGRILFTFGAARQSTPPPTPPPTTRAARPAPSPGDGGRPRPVPRTSSRSSRLNVKYAGFVEKTGPTGDKAKYAIFLSGTEILTGAEGDTVADFTVVSIGLESVTVSARGSSATERIPLSAN